MNTSPRYKIENYVLYRGNYKKNWVLTGHDEPGFRVQFFVFAVVIVIGCQI